MIANALMVAAKLPLFAAGLAELKFTNGIATDAVIAGIHIAPIPRKNGLGAKLSAQVTQRGIIINA